jgi:uncharacterized RDD family membrane protein YckC
MNVRYAGFWRRFGAFIVDALILLPVSFGLTVLGTWSVPLGIAVCAANTAVRAIYAIYFVGRSGKTPGKAVAGIKVVDVNGGPASWSQAILRWSVYLGFDLARNAARLAAFSRMSAGVYQSLGWREQGRALRQLEPSVSHALIWILSSWVVIEAIVLLQNRKKRALHDFIAGTVVVVDGRGFGAD